MRKDHSHLFLAIIPATLAIILGFAFGSSWQAANDAAAIEEASSWQTFRRLDYAIAYPRTGVIRTIAAYNLPGFALRKDGLTEQVIISTDTPNLSDLAGLADQEPKITISVYRTDATPQARMKALDQQKAAREQMTIAGVPATVYRTVSADSAKLKSVTAFVKKGAATYVVNIAGITARLSDSDIARYLGTFSAESI